MNGSVEDYIEDMNTGEKESTLNTTTLISCPPSYEGEGEESDGCVWVFGYGSLMWKRGSLQWHSDAVGYVEGMARRFWQGSPDHRGVPEAPGRVLTMVDESNVRTWGVAIKISRDYLPLLDQRETGYVRKNVMFHPVESGKPFTVQVYIALEDYTHHLGPAPLEHLASDIAFRRGTSGCNAEYLLALCDYLNSHSVLQIDSHLSELEARVRKLLSETPSPLNCTCVYHTNFLKQIPR